MNSNHKTNVRALLPVFARAEAASRCIDLVPCPTCGAVLGATCDPGYDLMRGVYFPKRGDVHGRRRRSIPEAEQIAMVLRGMDRHEREDWLSDEGKRRVAIDRDRLQARLRLILSRRKQAVEAEA